MRGSRLTVAAFLLAALTFTAGLGLLPLTQPDEGRNALVAAEMLDSGRWLVPTLGQVDYLDKPAFFFRAVGLSLGVFGHTELAARLPSALAACALAGIAWAFARRFHGARVAALAVVVLATTPLFVVFARLVIFDMVLTLFVSSAIVAGFLAEASEGARGRRWYLAAAAAAGLATLVKGPVGFVVPALVHFTTAKLNGQRGFLRRSFAPANIAIFLAVVLPWFVGVSLRAPDFPYYGVVYETVARVTTKTFRRTQPPWFYAGVLGGGVLPWSLLVPGAALAVWRGRRSLLPADRLLVVWSIVVVLFFSLPSSKQPAYVLSVCVPLAIGVARLLDAAIARPAGRAARQLRGAAFVLAFLTAIAAAAGFGLRASPELLARLPGPTDQGGSLWLPSLAGVGAACVGLAGIATVAAVRKSAPLAVASLALLLPTFLAAASPALRDYAEARSSRGLANRLGVLPPDVEVVCIRCFPSALPFYLRRPVTLVSEDASELRSNYVLFGVSRSGTPPPGVVPPSELSAWLAGRRHPVYLLGRDDEQARLGAIAAERGVGVTKLAPGYWAALLPEPSGS